MRATPRRSFRVETWEEAGSSGDEDDDDDDDAEAVAAAAGP